MVIDHDNFDCSNNKKFKFLPIKVYKNKSEHSIATNAMFSLACLLNVHVSVTPLHQFVTQT